MTTMHAGLLADILAHPADDAPRLILADYLEEHGDEDRASFIRVQCKPCQRGSHTCQDLAAPVESLCTRCTRERELIEAHDEWFPGLTACLNPANHVPAEDMPAVVSRGFVASITCTAEAWLTHADALTACQPIEAVTLTKWPNFDLLMQRGWRNAKDFTGKTCSELFAAEWQKISFTFPPGEDMTDLNSLLYALQNQAGTSG